MRKVLLVVALIGASFAGGAAVNGPGLQWLKGFVRDRMARDEPIPTLDVDDGSTAAEAEPATLTDAPVIDDAPKPVDPPKPEPEAHPAPAEPLPQKQLSVEPKAQDPDPPADLSPLPALPEPPSPAPPLRSPKDQASAKSGWEDAPGTGPATAVVPGRKPHDPVADSAVSAAAAPADPPPLASSSPEPSAMPVPPSGPATGDWAALRKRMAALGVQEYEVKGTPGGPVHFRCLVPGTGQEPARPFEAEADDEFQAADSALRRVAVWRAARRVKK